MEKVSRLEILEIILFILNLKVCRNLINIALGEVNYDNSGLSTSSTKLSQFKIHSKSGTPHLRAGSVIYERARTFEPFWRCTFLYKRRIS